jgi:ubiquinone/menaquinone biosynthesis C-methylase UbiE
VTITPTATTTPPPDLTALRARQQQTWASGDYSAVGATLQLIAERLVDSADLQAGWRVLDVAGGSGNVALAASRAGCEVICTDYVPSLLERAGERAAAERLPIEIREAAAEDLPFPDASFDAVVSAIGVMFAADHAAAAAELVRVCRPGGSIALASWTPEGFVGGMLRTVAKHVTPPAGAQPPTRWGTEETVEELLGPDVGEIRHRRRTYTFRFRSAAHFVEFFRDNYGPTHKAFGALDADGQRALRDDLIALITAHARTSGTGAVSIPATYLESVATRTS